MEFTQLDWDSNLLGIPVARITRNSITVVELPIVLSTLRASGIRLAYWLSSQQIQPDVIERCGGLHADTRMRYSIDFTSYRSRVTQGSNAFLSLGMSHNTSELETLAIQSGQFSRFAVDPQIPRESFETLYKIWMRKSLSRELAFEVLGVAAKGDIAGVVTLENASGIGRIGLIAVDHKHRQQGLGEQLVRAAQNRFINEGFQHGDVITQRANHAACRLYEKCGYRLESQDFHYHFWL